MGKKTVNFLKLLQEKKYSLIVSIIENELKDEERTASILNLSGVARMLSSKSNNSIKLAIKDFKNSCYKETNKDKLFDPFKNFINASVILFDNEFRNNENELNNNFFEEIHAFYNKNKILFEKDIKIMWDYSKVIKLTENTRDVINYFEKIMNFTPNLDTPKSNDIIPNKLYSFTTYNFFNNYLNDWSQSDFLSNSKKINNKLHTYKENELTKIQSSKKSKINLGFISSDLRSKHSVGYFLRSLLTHHDKDKYNIFLYNNHVQEDETTREFSSKVFKSIQIGKLKDVEVINLIRKDLIDIMIDLNGYSSDHRLVLLKNRLAPIQISWCGYTNTTGLNEMDYLIIDQNLVKKNEENLYSEKLIYLSDIWNCHSGYDFKRDFNPTPLKKNRHITFGSFNNFRKINDDVIEVWSEILKKIKGSKLLLKTSFPISKEIYKKKFNKYGVLDSIIFLPFKKDFDNHLDIYKQIDIALDTFPWNGVTTSFEAIWMGVPVITMKGYNFNSRCGESINRNARLENLIAKNKKDYIDKTILLAHNEDELEKIRKDIYENALNTPLFDQKKFCNQFFTSLEQIYN